MNYNAPVISDHGWNIEKALQSVTYKGYKGTYDGNSYGITVSPDGGTVTYGEAEGIYDMESSPTFSDAGTYTVYFKVVKENYEDYYNSAIVSITKANHDMSNIVWSGHHFVYNGNERSVTIIEGLPSGVTVKKYTDNSAINVGNYQATVTFNYDTVNYNEPVIPCHGWNIVEALQDVTYSGFEGAYDGSAHGITVIHDGNVTYGTVEGIYDLTESPVYTNVGEYTVYFRVTKANYEDFVGTVLISITKANYVIGEITWTEDRFVYDGTPKSIEILGGLPAGVTVHEYTNNEATNADAYSANATFNYDTANYNAPVIPNHGWNIGPKDITGADIVLDGTSTVYTGFAIEPGIESITIGALLGSGDYEIDSYGENINVATGGTVTIKGIGNYTGTEIKIFTISPKSVTGADVTLDETSTVYTGSAIEPGIVSVKLDGTTLATDNYTVSYGDNANVATGGSVTVTGIGNYTGTETKTFAITPKALTVTYAGETVTYGDVPELVLAVTGFVYGENAETAAGYVGPTIANGNLNVGKYTLTSVGGAADNYTFGHKEGDLKIIPKNITGADITLDETSTVYTGSAIEPGVVSVELDGTTLASTDFTVTYGDNINVATGGTVTVKGIGNYTGTITENFTITKAELIKPTDNPASFVYNEDEQEYEPIGFDATIMNIGGNKRTDAGSQTVTVSIKDAANYQWKDGTVADITYQFEISKKDVIVIPDSGQTKIYGEIDPTFTYELSETIAVEGTLARITDENVGRHTITLGTLESVSGNYRLIMISPSVVFEIKAKDISDANIDDIEDQIYTGYEIEPEITVTIDGITLVRDVDYTVSYENNIGEGESRVIATGIGNYAGSIGITFIIKNNPDIVSVIIGESTPVFAFLILLIVPIIWYTRYRTRGQALALILF